MEMLKRAFLVFALIPAIAPLSAQKQEKIPTFAAEVNLATVSFRQDFKGQPVDLSVEDVVLLEDGKPRKLTFFERGSSKRRTLPIELIWLVERSVFLPYTSGFVPRGGINPKTFYDGIFAITRQIPDLYTSLYGFDIELWRCSQRTRNTDSISRAFQDLLARSPSAPKIALQLPTGRRLVSKPAPLDDKRAPGSAWLYESIIATLRDAAMSTGNTFRAIVVVSFGASGTDSTCDDVSQVANEVGIPVYPVVLGYSYRVAPGSGSPQYPQNPSYASLMEQGAIKAREFASLGNKTGAGEFLLVNLSDDGMRLIIRTIEDHILHSYIAGFSPGAIEGSPRKHELEIKLVSKGKGKIIGGKRTVWY